ncbi:MAG: tyrosine transporter [Verrucomicrobia bacterium]|nr:tyrosine transporter [Verrucomicrobiota bacterium]
MTNKVMGTFGGALIITGTSIGAGMLALPVVTSPAGFLPSIAVLIACWAFMTITGLLFAELSIWLKQEVNILSMARKTLGAPGAAITWILYLFLFYCLTVAYLVGGAGFLTDFTSFGLSDTARVGLVAFVLIALIANGRRIVDPINRVLMIGLIAAYVGFVLIGSPAVRLDLLQHGDWSKASFALPVAFTSFGFQGTVPTLASWMQYDAAKIRRSIVIGTTITLLIYIIWQWLFLGIVPPDGPHGLVATLEAGQDAVHPLYYFTNNQAIWTLGRAFAFFALATSTLGVGVGLVDFLADGLGIAKRGLSRMALLLILAFGVPLLFAATHPHVFLEALGLAGGFGCAILLGVLPIIMIWKAEKSCNCTISRSWIYSKPAYAALLLFVIFEISVEIFSLISRNI